MLQRHFNLEDFIADTLSKSFMLVIKTLQLAFTKKYRRQDGAHILTRTQVASTPEKKKCQLQTWLVHWNILFICLQVWLQSDNQPFNFGCSQVPDVQQTVQKLIIEEKLNKMRNMEKINLKKINKLTLNPPHLYSLYQ